MVKIQKFQLWNILSRWTMTAIPSEKKGVGKRDNGSYTLYFLCTGCEIACSNLMAIADVLVNDISKPKTDEYTLQSYPCVEQHICIQIGIELEMWYFSISKLGIRYLK